MDKFLEVAYLAWNPVGEVRKRSYEGTLSFGSVFVRYMGIVIACNLFTLGAQRFFLECVLSQMGGQLPDIPILKNEWVQRFMSVLGVIAPVGTVSLLPSRVFHPSSRNEITASILIIFAASAFYGALLTAPIYFFSGFLVLADLQLGLTIFKVLSILSSVVLVVLLVVFWLKITLTTLEIRFSKVVLISLVGLLTISILIVFLTLVVNAITTGND